ncbi:MAG: NUDIX hydrolase [Candidatus Dormiibacterota bacterium]
MVLIRAGGTEDGPPEVLLLERADRAHFAPRAQVFPGGSVDPDDRDPRWRELWSPGALVGLDPRAPLELRIAAVRETFEECGVLLAEPIGELPVPTAAGLERERSAWRLDGRGSFFQLMERLGLRPSATDLIFCAHWLTPEGLSHRFDARFFLAELPRDQSPRPDPMGESGRWRWADPATALEEGRQGECQVLPPTRAVLEWLALGHGVSGTLQAARNTEVVTEQPRLEDVTAERYPGLDRSRLESE